MVNSIKTIFWLKLFIIAIVLMAVGLFSAIFFFTYPLNIGGYDGPNYLNMLVRNESNLIHASGYPLILSFLLSSVTDWSVTSFFDTSFLNEILITQYLFHLSILFTSTVIVMYYFGLLPSLVMMFLWGTSISFLSGVSSMRPEWMQGGLIALSTILCLGAFLETRRYAKFALYALSFLIFVFAYLVKFNSLPLLSLFVVLLLFESEGIWFRLKVFGTCVITWFLVVFAFVEYYHYPSTGTRDLTYDHAWILVPATGFEILESEGLSARRWRAMSAVVPPDYGRAGAYRHIDDIAPKDERLEYVSIYNKIMQMNEEDLKDFIENNPLPEDYSYMLSAIPLYYYVGLKETDKLGIDLFLEHVLNNPVGFAWGVIEGVFSTTPTMVLSTMVPTKENLLDLKINSDFTQKCCILESIKPWYTNLYWNPDMSVNETGMAFVSHMKQLAPGRIFELTVFMFSILIFFWNTKSKDRQLIFALAIAWLAFVSANQMVGVMRHQEAFAIWPFTTLFWALTLSQVVGLLLSLISQQNDDRRA